MTARICAWSSFKVKYACPDCGREKFEISPDTHTSGNPPSSEFLICDVNCATVSVRWVDCSGAEGTSDQRNVEEFNISASVALIFAQDTIRPRARRFAG